MRPARRACLEAAARQKAASSAGLPLGGRRRLAGLALKEAASSPGLGGRLARLALGEAASLPGLP